MYVLCGLNNKTSDISERQPSYVFNIDVLFSIFKMSCDNDGTDTKSITRDNSGLGYNGINIYDDKDLNVIKKLFYEEFMNCSELCIYEITGPVAEFANHYLPISAFKNKKFLESLNLEYRKSLDYPKPLYKLQMFNKEAKDNMCLVKCIDTKDWMDFVLTSDSKPSHNKRFIKILKEYGIVKFHNYNYGKIGLKKFILGHFKIIITSMIMIYVGFLYGFVLGAYLSK